MSDEILTVQKAALPKVADKTVHGGAGNLPALSMCAVVARPARRPLPVARTR